MASPMQHRSPSRVHLVFAETNYSLTRFRSGEALELLLAEFAFNERNTDTKPSAAAARYPIAQNHGIARPGTGALNNDPLWVPQRHPSPPFRWRKLYAGI